MLLLSIRYANLILDLNKKLYAILVCNAENCLLFFDFMKNVLFCIIFNIDERFQVCCYKITNRGFSAYINKYLIYGFQ